MSDIIETIYSSPQLKMEYLMNSNANGMIVITFTERTNRNLDAPGFGTAFLLKSGFDVIAIKTNRDVWYENFLPEHQLIVNDSIKKFGRKYSLRIAYGSSMGGYAAIRFSKPLLIDRVLAISPLFDIKQSWDTRWASDLLEMNNEIMMNCDLINREAKYFFIFDPKNPDRMHVDGYRKIIPDGNLFELKIPYSGHPSGAYLKETNSLTATVLNVFLKEAFPSIEKSQKIERKKSESYCFNLAGQCLLKKKYKLAIKINALATDINPGNSEYHIQAAKIFERLGDIEAALSASQKAVDINPTHIHMQRYHEKLLNLNRSRE